MERKLASIRKINEIRPIEGADLIEIAVVGGWYVIVKKGEYKANDLAVYFEIDSWIPTELAEFLSNGKEPREYNGVKGERLRSKKMRGVVSQGLLLPIDEVINKIPKEDIQYLDGGYIKFGEADPVRLFEEGSDLTEILGIQKWEKPISAQLQGVAKGNFPTHISPKTDAERIQNLTNRIQGWKDRDLKFEVTEKLDGTSFTYVRFKYGDDHYESHVCSRNLSLEETEENLYWQIARKYDIINKVEELGLNISIQGEIIGQNVQSGQFKIPPELRVFNIYDIDNHGYMEPHKRIEICEKLGLLHAPRIADELSIRDFDGVQEMLAFAEGKSIINGTEREGLVWKCTTDNTIMFKTISNKWLLKNE
jgi:RNA ligase (TIGR02306 family)